MFGPSNPDEAAASVECDSLLAKAASWPNFIAMGLKINPAASALDLLSKAERRELTDVVQEHALNAQARGDSTTPVERWIMAATKTVSAALFENEFCESISGIRERLTPRQLRRLAMAEEVYAGAIASYLDSGLHHKLVNAEAKRAVMAFASMTGGKEVPGVDVSARMRLGRAAPRRHVA